MGFATIVLDGLGDAAPAEAARSRLLREYQKVQRSIGATGEKSKQLRTTGATAEADALLAKVRELAAQGRVVHAKILADSPDAPGLLRKLGQAATDLANEAVAQLDRVGRSVASGVATVGAEAGKGLLDVAKGAAGSLKYVGLGLGGLVALVAYFKFVKPARKSNPHRRRRR